MAHDSRSSRSDVPVRIFPLREQPGDLSTTTSAEERVAMVWELTLQSWELSGRPMPVYSRHEAPVRTFPLAESP